MSVIEKVEKLTDLEILQIVRLKFLSGEWTWIQGKAHDGNNGYCLVGAFRAANGEKTSRYTYGPELTSPPRKQEKISDGPRARVCGLNFVICE